MAIIYKSSADIEKMRAANLVVCAVLDQLEEMIEPGVNTGMLEDRAKGMVKEFGVKPAFLGYGSPPFPAMTCISINEEVVHGIPCKERILQEGDIVSIDFGVDREGFFGDSARTIAVGNISAAARKLMDVTSQSLDKAIEQCVEGNRLREVSRAVQEHVEENGFSVVRDFVGHGIGRDMHEDPRVPNFVTRGRNPRLRDGMVLAIEPMVNLGKPGIVIDARDHWTARTRDGKLSAHFEHSVAISSNGPLVLSRKN